MGEEETGVQVDVSSRAVWLWTRGGMSFLPEPQFGLFLYLLWQPCASLPRPSPMHILLTSSTRSSRLAFSQKSPKLSSHLKRRMHLAGDSPAVWNLFMNCILWASPGLITRSPRPPAGSAHNRRSII